MPVIDLDAKARTAARRPPRLLAVVAAGAVLFSLAGEPAPPPVPTPQVSIVFDADGNQIAKFSDGQ